MVRTFFWIGTILIFSFSDVCFGASDRVLPLEGKLNALLPEDALWALDVMDMDTGQPIISMGNGKDKMLAPGSLVKLVISGAVLDHETRQAALDLTTTIGHDGFMSAKTLQGNLYMIGRGNALISKHDMESAAKSLVQKGVGKIEGDIIAADTLFDAKGLNRTRTGPAYAPAGALGMDLHTAAVHVFPTKAGAPPDVRMEPPNDEIKIVVTARTVAGTPTKISVTQIDDVSYVVAGNIAEGTAAVKRRFSQNDPAFYSAGVLKTLLRRSGIVVSGKVRKGQAPASAVPLTEIREHGNTLRDMNVNSLNVIADNLLLLLGGTAYGFPGTREKGLQAIGEFLGSLGFSPDEYTIRDGAVLSEGNRLSSKFIARYLQKASKQSWFGAFKESLPRAGMDGTLKDIGFVDSRFRAKTGRLENTYGVAGFGESRTGKKLAFCYLVNAKAADLLGLEKSGGEIMRYLATEGAL
jgi:D-alanyl-D-alanine carboxypeptidase/D-alanyl-D-alanine-endopeptidase (penicillin-binding protein 4)